MTVSFPCLRTAERRKIKKRVVAVGGHQRAVVRPVKTDVTVARGLRITEVKIALRTSA